MPGLFLSLDGLDGTGKSTQGRLLADWLRELGHQVTECRDPGGTPLGDQFRAIVLDNRSDISAATEAFLFMASRSELVAKIIRPALTANHIVICDRFLLATIVYQGHAGGLDVEALRKMGELATGGIMPQLTFVFDIPVETAVLRRNRDADRLESRALDYHERVRAGFLQEAKCNADTIRVIDASESIEDIQHRIRDLVQPLLTKA